MPQSAKRDASFLTALPLLHRLVLSAYPCHAEYHLTRTQIVILAALELREELTMSQIADFISASKEQATRAVAPLADKGMVERFISDDNRTRVYVHLTESGKAFMTEFREAFYSRLDARTERSLSAQERDELYRAVTVTVELLEKIC